MLKNSKVILFLLPQKVGQAGNFWTLLRTYIHDIDVSWKLIKYQSKLKSMWWIFYVTYVAYDLNKRYYHPFRIHYHTRINLLLKYKKRKVLQNLLIKKGVSFSILFLIAVLSPCLSLRNLLTHSINIGLHAGPLSPFLHNAFNF